MDQIQLATQFLLISKSNSKSNEIYPFLKSKGLTDQEIELAIAIKNGIQRRNFIKKFIIWLFITGSFSVLLATKIPKLKSFLLKWFNFGKKKLLNFVQTENTVKTDDETLIESLNEAFL